VLRLQFGSAELEGSARRNATFRAVLSRAGYRAPAKLEEKIRGLVPRKGRSTQFSWLQRWTWAGGGAAFATAALLIAFVVARPVPPSADQEIVSSHVRSLMADHLMDVISTDQHTVKPWFDGKIDFAPPVVDLKEQGYPLAGGRLDYLENRTVAVLVYHRALHTINLYVWPAAARDASAIQKQTLQGYNVLSWKKNGFEFRAVSDLNTAELEEFARLVTP
jgi:anti-sigma factor RsiW